MSSWYELAQGTPLFQGDILRKCPVPVLPFHYPPDAKTAIINSPVVVETELEVRDVIVISQSCDLVNKKLSSVLVGPLWNLDRLPELTDNPKLKEEPKNFRSTCDFIREGNSPRFHMLDKCEIGGHDQNFRIVDFWSVYTVPFSFAEAFANYSGERLRLVSPYTEHLSQAFARFVMRVGLPSTIPEFKK